MRWRIEGDTAARDQALGVLIRDNMNVVNMVTPSGTNKPYLFCAYPSVMAATFDLMHAELTPAERATIVNRLESWVNAISGGTSPAGQYGAFSGSVDNISFSWHGAQVMALLAIWGEPSTTISDIPGEVATVLGKLEAGWNDAVSPGGSYDESAGYALYGVQRVLRSALAAQRCGFPDIISPTAIRLMPRWYGSLLMGDAFPWTGDSSANHGGVDVDPILYAVAAQESDGEGFWALERIRGIKPVDELTTTWAWSPFVTMWLHYPTNLAAQPPEILSRFYPDNLNLAPMNAAHWNKTNNHGASGEGGAAFLHNSVDPSDFPFALHYLIRDEWMNHAHEDDGHVDLMANGKMLLMDRGYARVQTGAGAQSIDHNICSVGNLEFNGSSSNHFNPPIPSARFHGSMEGLHLGQKIDYVRGSHSHVWQMDRGDRTVVLIKDTTVPYALVLDQLQANIGGPTYHQRWNTPASMGGAGTASNPYSTATGGAVLRGFNLGSDPVSLVSGGSAIQPNSNAVYYANRLEATEPSAGVGVEFLTMFASSIPSSIQPLPTPGVGTKGAVVQWSSTEVDHILLSDGANQISAGSLNSNGRFAWARTNQSGTVQEFFLGEGSYLQQGSVLLASASETVNISLRDGICEITRKTPSALAAVVVLHVNGSLTSAYLDGESVPFVQNGPTALIGSLGSVSADWDRFYSFNHNMIWDAVLSGGVMHALDRIVGTTGGEVRFSAGHPYSPAPMEIGASWTAPPAGGLVGALRIDGILGTFLRVEVTKSGSSLQCHVIDLLQGPQVLGSVPLENGQGRTVFLVDPCQATIALKDRFGVQQGTLPIGNLTMLALPALEVAAFASVDDVALFDSAENGHTPQGSVVWGAPSGHAGIAVRADGLTSGSYTLTGDGIPIPASSAATWLQIAGFHEFLHLQGLTAANLLTVDSFAIESAIPALVPSASFTYGMIWTLPSGLPLSSTFTY